MTGNCVISRNCGQSIGPKVSIAKSQRKAQGVQFYTLVEMMSLYNPNEARSELFPSQAPEDRAAT